MRVFCWTVLSVKFDLIVAIAAIDGSILTRLERYYRISAALGTYYGEHLSRGSIAVSTVTITLRLPCPAAFGASFWLVLETTGRIELLLSGGEYEILPAI